MKKLLLTIAITATMPVAFAQTALSVNGQTISAQQQKELMELLQAQGITDEKQRLNAARNILIARAVVAQEIRKLKLDQDVNLRERIEGQKDNLYVETLGRRYLQDKKPTQKDLDDAYKTFKDQYDPTFIQISVITVKTEPEAKEIIAQANKGADFATLAKEKSLDPQAKDNAGQLPMANIKQFQGLPGLQQAAASVEAGKVIQAPFHVKDLYTVVKVDKKEQREPPTEKDLEKQLTEMWARTQVNNYVMDLVKQANITEAAPAPTGKKK
ncbi:MAG: peptidylprolyl isomerase [Burkholderiales bacterium]|nr:peptidylprolyl isomerase [Burkholderiales bacterium]